MKARHREVTDYDAEDSSGMINPQRRLSLADLGFKLPPSPPTQVVSIRLPTKLLNLLRAKASALDVPYQALIKLALSRYAQHRSS